MPGTKYEWVDGRLKSEEIQIPSGLIRRNYNWDPNNSNRLLSVSEGNTIVAEYTYFKNGRLKSRTIYGGDTEEFSATGWPDGLFDVKVNNQRTERYVFIGGKLGYFEIGAKKYWVADDRSVKSVYEEINLISGPAAKLLQTYSYDSKGIHYYARDENGAIIITGPISRFLFHSQFFDNIANLYYIQDRGWYHPGAGQMLDGTQVDWSVPKVVQPLSRSSGHDYRDAQVPTAYTLTRPFTPRVSKKGKYSTVESFWGNAYELHEETVVICHGVNRLTNTMVGPPNSFANLPRSLKYYVGIRDLTARATAEVGLSMLIPGSIGIRGLRTFAANSVLQSAKFAAVHEGFGKIAMDEEISVKRFATNTLIGAGVHGAIGVVLIGPKRILQSSLAREYVLAAALRNPNPNFSGMASSRGSRIVIRAPRNPSPSPVAVEMGIDAALAPQYVAKRVRELKAFVQTNFPGKAGGHITFAVWARPPVDGRCEIIIALNNPLRGMPLHEFPQRGIVRPNEIFVFTLTHAHAEATAIWHAGGNAIGGATRATCGSCTGLMLKNNVHSVVNHRLLGVNPNIKSKNPGMFQYLRTNAGISDSALNQLTKKQLEELRATLIPGYKTSGRYGGRFSTEK